MDLERRANARTLAWQEHAEPAPIARVANDFLQSLLNVNRDAK